MEFETVSPTCVHKRRGERPRTLKYTSGRHILPSPITRPPVDPPKTLITTTHHPSSESPAQLTSSPRFTEMSIENGKSMENSNIWQEHQQTFPSSTTIRTWRAYWYRCRSCTPRERRGPRTYRAAFLPIKRSGHLSPTTPHATCSPLRCTRL